jgi:hypothetical protein
MFDARNPPVATCLRSPTDCPPRRSRMRGSKRANPRRVSAAVQRPVRKPTFPDRYREGVCAFLTWKPRVLDQSSASRCTQLRPRCTCCGASNNNKRPSSRVGPNASASSFSGNVGPARPKFGSSMSRKSVFVTATTPAGGPAVGRVLIARTSVAEPMSILKIFLNAAAVRPFRRALARETRDRLPLRFRSHRSSDRRADTRTPAPRPSRYRFPAGDYSSRFRMFPASSAPS